MLNGTPIAIAIAAVVNVPKIYGKAPKDSRPSTAFQSVLVINDNPSSSQIGYDSTNNS